VSGEPAGGRVETLPNRFSGRPYRVELSHLEFTSICPLTGAPDFGTITIRYVPGEKLLELRSLRNFLTGFRDRKILQEEVVNEILDEVVASAGPLFAEVEGVFDMRGGMTTRAVARAGDDPQGIEGGAGSAVTPERHEKARRHPSVD